MPALVEFSTAEGCSVLVQVEDDAPLGLQPVADANVAGKSAKSFQEALSALAPVADSVFKAIKEIKSGLTEVEVELGFKISGSGTLILCSAEMEASFTTTLKWNLKNSA